MNCKQVEPSLAAYCDGRLSGRERLDVAAHVAECAHCASASEGLLRVREVLQGLPGLDPPAELTTALRILASRERVRRVSGAGFGSLFGRWALLAKMWADDMMRPVALPMAGGLISAMILFALLVVPMVDGRGVSNVRDVPTPLFTEASFVSMGPFGLNDDDYIVVDVTVGSGGRMVDYSTPSGQQWVNNPEVRKSVENALLFTVFNPGTKFFQPKAGKVRLTLRRSQIEVKG